MQGCPQSNAKQEINFFVFKDTLKAMRTKRKQVGYNLFEQELNQGFDNEQTFKEHKKVQRRIQEKKREKEKSL
jgi:hypothetical protein